MAYGDDDGFEDWMDAMGYSLPGGAPTPAILRTRGSTWLDGTYESAWCGYRTDGVMQTEGWPRTNARLNCVSPIPSDVIPPAIINASYRAAYLEGTTPGILAGSALSSGPRVKRQKVDVIEREFFDDGKAEAGAATGFIDAEIDGAMRPFICADSGGFLFMSVGS